MIYLGNLILISGTTYKVGLTANEVNSTGKSKYGGQYDLSKGVLVDALPEPDIPNGKIISNTMVDTSTKIVSYEYIDKPVSKDDQLQQQISILGQQVAALTLTQKGGETA